VAVKQTQELNVGCSMLSVSDCLFLVIAFICMLLLSGFFDNVNPFAADSPAYTKGYNAGFTEQNITKYQAAKNVTDVAFFDTACTAEQYEYAKGYQQGYQQGCNQRQEDTRKASINGMLNESLQTLGV
jgi:hypothetical protein